MAGLERTDEETAASASAERGGPAWLEWIANAANAGLFERANDGPGYPREQVSVFVRVRVGELEAGALQFLDLRECLALDVVRCDRAAKDAECEVCEGVAEGATALTVFWAEECGDACRVRDRDTVDEDDMTADAERWTGEGEGDCVVEGCTAGHESCGANGAGVMQLGDSAIDAAGEAEVIRIDDEANRH